MLWPILHYRLDLRNSRAAISVANGTAMWWLLLFILVHVTLVFITGARVNLNMTFAGVHDGS
jgi:hypothetical protein